jgi:hypothetical protein
MKKIFLTLAVMAVAAMGVSSAHAGVAISIGVRAPVYTYAAPVYYPAPQVFYAQPAPAPVVVYRAPVPVYYAPAPVYCAPAPVYCAPAPVVRLRFGFHPFYRHGRW